MWRSLLKGCLHQADKKDKLDAWDLNWKDVEMLLYLRIRINDLNITIGWRSGGVVGQAILYRMICGSISFKEKYRIFENVFQNIMV